MLSFSKHCQSIGFPLKNIRWSWAAASLNGSCILFTVWHDEIRQGGYIIYPVTARRPGQIPDKANEQLGAREARRLAEIAATDSEIHTYGIECFANKIDSPTRTRKSFDRRNLLRLCIGRDNRGFLVATILGSETVSAKAQLEH